MHCVLYWFRGAVDTEEQALAFWAASAQLATWNSLPCSTDHSP